MRKNRFAFRCLSIFGFRPRAIALALGYALIGTMAIAAPAQAVTQIFGYTGGEQTFTVPGGVTKLQVLLIGAEGGEGGGAGGLGAQVSGDLEVTPGQALYLEVGGTGKASGAGGAGGFNGGGAGGGGTSGGGGGASDIRLLPRTLGLSPDTRLVVAAGGGGGGGDGEEAGPDGGDAGSAGGTLGNEGGGAGTATEGGLGGFGCGGTGTAGGPGQGGTGSSGESVSNAGGGGGGGLYGGGGGGGGCVASGGGGGGGSSLVPAGGTLGLASEDAAPIVAITYTLPSVTPPATNPPAPSASPAPPAPPNTVLGLRPAKKIKTTKNRVKVKFGFSSNVAGATFQCKLDKGTYAPCASPKRYKAKAGKHKFSVRAIKDGVVDPTPATFKFTVVKVD